MTMPGQALSDAESQKSGDLNVRIPFFLEFRFILTLL